MSGHTPGPWSIKPGVFNYEIDIRVGGNTLATVYGSTGENLCNAQVMTAAPELLEALELLLDGQHCRITMLRSDGPLPTDKARAAIAKAKGEV